MRVWEQDGRKRNAKKWHLSLATKRLPYFFFGISLDAPSKHVGVKTHTRQLYPTMIATTKEMTSSIRSVVNSATCWAKILVPREWVCV